MVHDAKCGGALVLRLMVGLALLGWPRVSNAQGTWSVISLPQHPGDSLNPSALAADAVGNLYVADSDNGGRIQRRDAQGNWSVIASNGSAPGRVSGPLALAVDMAGTLYVADGSGIQKRDTQGTWSLIAAAGTAIGQVDSPSALAVDTTGNLYAAEAIDYYGFRNPRIQKRDSQGNWSVIATQGASALAIDSAGNLYVADWRNGWRIQKRDGQGNWSVIATQNASALAADPAGNLYVAAGGIQKRDTQGNWSVIATWDWGLGPVWSPAALAVDRAGNLYVADTLNGSSYGRIQKRDARGNWLVVATSGSARGQVVGPQALAVDTAGNLYVAEESYYDALLGATVGIDRIQKRDAQGNWSVVATSGDAPGQVVGPSALAVDSAGNLYVEDYGSGPRIQKRDARGGWSLIDGSFARSRALTVDAAGNLYEAGISSGGIVGTTFSISKQDVPGTWRYVESYIVPQGWGANRSALAVDFAGNLYVAEYSWAYDYQRLIVSRIRKLDTQGNWSVIATAGSAIGQVINPTALAADTAGNLYVAEQSLQDYAGKSFGGDRIQKRDAQGNWAVIATHGSDLEQVNAPGGLAVDGAGNLYVADSSNNRVLKYTPAP